MDPTPTPIPVVVVDWVSFSRADIDAAMDLARLGIFALVIAAGLLIFAAFFIAAATGGRS